MGFGERGRKGDGRIRRFGEISEWDGMDECIRYDVD